MSKILFIGNYPPPFSGQSIAFKMVYDEYSKTQSCFLINTIEKKGKRSFIFRFVDYLCVFIKLLFFL